jgi:hypothetical protein
MECEDACCVELTQGRVPRGDVKYSSSANAVLDSFALFSLLNFVCVHV